MSRSTSVRVPSYRLHKPTGQAVVRLNGRDFYLGKWQSERSKAEYERLVGEWLANNRRLPATNTETDKASETVAELLSAYLDFAKDYYRRDGEPTSEYAAIKQAIKPLARLYGHTSAVNFGPLAFKAVQNAMVDGGRCRQVINRDLDRIKRIFKWGVANEMLASSVYHGLQSVGGLRFGRSAARESEPVRPVPDRLVDGIRGYVSRHVWAMIELQRLTGMRPGEVTIMRGCDLDVTGGVWLYRPRVHKTQHHGHERIVDLGPKAQAIVREFLKVDRQAFLFSPREAEEERRTEQRMNRKTKVQPSQAKRSRKTNPAKSAQDHYTTGSYGRAIIYGCDKAFPHPTISKIKTKAKTAEQRAELKEWQREHRWHPHQLRHSFATRIRKEYGLETARVLLGHRTMAVSEIYAEIDREKVAAVVAAMG